MNIIVKLWIEKGGVMAFGMGIFTLLKLVKETGSLHKAAASLKMSYRAAWGRIRKFENVLGVELLEHGHLGRSGAHLTEAGEKAVDTYEKLIKKADDIRSSECAKTMFDSLKTDDKK